MFLSVLKLNCFFGKKFLIFFLILYYLMKSYEASKNDSCSKDLPTLQTRIFEQLYAQSGTIQPACVVYK